MPERLESFRYLSDSEMDSIERKSRKRLQEFTTLLNLFKMTGKTSPNEPGSYIGAAYTHLLINTSMMVEMLERNVAILKNIHRDLHLGGLQAYDELEGIMEMLDE